MTATMPAVGATLISLRRLNSRPEREHQQHDAQLRHRVRQRLVDEQRHRQVRARRRRPPAGSRARPAGAAAGTPSSSPPRHRGSAPDRSADRRCARAWALVIVRRWSPVAKLLPSEDLGCALDSAAMRRGRSTAGLVLGAFSAALTVLPWLHTLHHRDDHIHVDGGDRVSRRPRARARARRPRDRKTRDDDGGPPGFDHPAHHGPHGRGALAHGSAFILAGAVYLFPAPTAALEPAPDAASPDQPPPAARPSPRVTRGPPLAA